MASVHSCHGGRGRRPNDLLPPPPLSTACPPPRSSPNMAGHYPTGGKPVGRWMMADCGARSEVDRSAPPTSRVTGPTCDPAIIASSHGSPCLERRETPRSSVPTTPRTAPACAHYVRHGPGRAHRRLDVLAKAASRPPRSVGTGLGTSVQEIIGGLRRVIGWDTPSRSSAAPTS